MPMNQTCTYGNGTTLVLGLAYGDTYVRTDGHVTTKMFETDGLPNFLRYGAPHARLRCSGTPLLKPEE